MKVAVIGLGYVGLPLVAEFGHKHSVVGFDIHSQRVRELKDGIDTTGEVSTGELRSDALTRNVLYTTDPKDLAGNEVFIITVPTPVDEHSNPDLGAVRAASKTVGQYLKPGGIVVLESTVYPGCVEEICVPILEKESGLKFNEGFFCGYSPERVNPGDPTRRLRDITKIVSGSTPESTKKLTDLYQSILSKPVYVAPSIRVAEAAKVIENAQRDINIAFVNELAMMLDRMNLDTLTVLEAAGTKWNFLPFKPGLVGGHCIGVDPFYLAYKARQFGFHPEVLLAGRRVNDGVGEFIAHKLLKRIAAARGSLNKCRVLVCGITFKEDCPDIRNSKVIDVIRELQGFQCEVHVYDPVADAKLVHEEYGLELARTPFPPTGQAWDGVVVAVAHQGFKKMNFSELKGPGTVLFDVKGILDPKTVDCRL